MSNNFSGETTVPAYSNPIRGGYPVGNPGYINPSGIKFKLKKNKESSN